MIHISGLGTISPHPGHAAVTQAHLHHDCVTLQHLLPAIAFFLFMNHTDILEVSYFCSKTSRHSLSPAKVGSPCRLIIDEGVRVTGWGGIVLPMSHVACNSIVTNPVHIGKVRGGSFSNLSLKV